MKAIKTAAKTVTALGHLAREYPITFFFLIICILLAVYFEIWKPLWSLQTREWNVTNLELIRRVGPDDFSFAVFGNNRNSKFIFENLLKSIDHDLDISFAISLGNMVSRGKKEKYSFFLKQVKDTLGIPLITTMGNRELKAGGPDLYHKIFGPARYSFHIGKNYFMVLDNAGKEELYLMQKDGWLEKTLKESQQYDNRLVFMHMPLYDPRGEKDHQCMPPESSEKLRELFLDYNVTHIFSSNVHGYFQTRMDRIPIFITGGAGAKLRGTDPKHYFFHFLKVSIRGGRVEVQAKPVPCPAYARTDHLRYNLSYSYQYLKIHFIAVILLITAVGLALLIYRSKSRKRKARPIQQYPGEYQRNY